MNVQIQMAQSQETVPLTRNYMTEAEDALRARRARPAA